MHEESDKPYFKLGPKGVVLEGRVRTTTAILFSSCSSISEPFLQLIKVRFENLIKTLFLFPNNLLKLSILESRRKRCHAPGDRARNTDFARQFYESGIIPARIIRARNIPARNIAARTIPARTIPAQPIHGEAKRADGSSQKATETAKHSVFGCWVFLLGKVLAILFVSRHRQKM